MPGVKKKRRGQKSVAMEGVKRKRVTNLKSEISMKVADWRFPGKP